MSRPRWNQGPTLPVKPGRNTERFLVPEDIELPPCRQGWVALCRPLDRPIRSCLWQVERFFKNDTRPLVARFAVEGDHAWVYCDGVRRHSTTGNRIGPVLFVSSAGKIIDIHPT